ncbi:MAG: hypothetical protein ACRD8Z_10150 [Nitrososphaeraceae archaeon]
MPMVLNDSNYEVMVVVFLVAVASPTLGASAFIEVALARSQSAGESDD